MDLETGAVLASKNAGALNAPASLTKVMTLFVTLSAIENGELSIDESVTVTDRAAKQPAVRFGLHPNQLITVREAYGDAPHLGERCSRYLSRCDRH